MKPLDDVKVILPKHMDAQMFTQPADTIPDPVHTALQYHITQLRQQLANVEAERDSARRILDATATAVGFARTYDASAIPAYVQHHRNILAALREPSETMMVAMGEADAMHGDVSEERLTTMLRAAVAAADKEVRGE